MNLSSDPSATRVLGARQRSSAEDRERLLASALVEFADHDFDSASTRAIAQGADAHPPRINYHFSCKERLWKAVILRLLDEMDAAIVVPPDVGPRGAMESIIRGIVTPSAVRPELNRLMIHEGPHPSTRLVWLVDDHIRPRAEVMLAIWNELQATGEAAPISRNLIYRLPVGSSSLLYANAHEARLLLDIEPPDPVVVHAHALVSIFLPLTSKQDPS